MTAQPSAERRRILNFGSSVLRTEENYSTAAQDVYRHVREGEKVIALVPATNALPEQAMRVGDDACQGSTAHGGELRPAALMALALRRIGVQACAMDAHEIGLVARGDALHADLAGDALPGRLGDHEVVVVPGFTAGHAERGMVTLDLGGTDPSAVVSAARPLRVAMLGCGAVGAGVLAHLQARPDLFALNPVLVRTPARHGGPTIFTDRLEDALADGPDIVIELIGGADRPAEIMGEALGKGVHVVTANKSAVAKHWDALHAAAARGGADLRYSAAVGGGAPILEALARHGGEVVEVTGVMNGTANYLLGKLGEGWSFDRALAQAQALGFAEADPTADVDGHDAADKLAILARAAFGVAPSTAHIPKASLRDVTPRDVEDALARGETLKQVGRCRLEPDGALVADVRILSLPARHPLARPRDEENCFLIRLRDGSTCEVFGRGAGRWPTAASVFADVVDVQRAVARRAMDAREPMPMRVRA